MTCYGDEDRSLVEDDWIEDGIEQEVVEDEAPICAEESYRRIYDARLEATAVSIADIGISESEGSINVQIGAS